MGNSKQEMFCYDCKHVEFYPASFIDPGGYECPGNFDPDSPDCPRHGEWIRELSEDEDEEVETDETDEVDVEEF